MKISDELYKRMKQKSELTLRYRYVRRGSLGGEEKEFVEIPIRYNKDGYWYDDGGMSYDIVDIVYYCCEKEFEEDLRVYRVKYAIPS